MKQSGAAKRVRIISFEFANRHIYGSGGGRSLSWCMLSLRDNSNTAGWVLARSLALVAYRRLCVYIRGRMHQGGLILCLHWSSAAPTAGSHRAHIHKDALTHSPHRRDSPLVLWLTLRADEPFLRALVYNS